MRVSKPSTLIIAQTRHQNHAPVSTLLRPSHACVSGSGSQRVALWRGQSSSLQITVSQTCDNIQEGMLFPPHILPDCLSPQGTWSLVVMGTSVCTVHLPELLFLSVSLDF